jgi:predicted amidohydrolase YtcJ
MPVLPPSPSPRPAHRRPRARAAAALAAVLAAARLGAQPAPPPAGPPPDLVLLGGKVFTADSARPWAEAVAVRGDPIVAVGATADVAALAGPATRRLALGGRVVVPGFNDAHIHMGWSPDVVEVRWGAIAGRPDALPFDPVPPDRVTAALAAAVKYILDGRPLERIGLMRRPYADRRGWHGRAAFPPDTLRAWLRAALAAPPGAAHQLMLHVTGDSTAALVLRLMTELGPDSAWARRRVRFEHGDGRAADLRPLARRLGVIAVQNPAHLTTPRRSSRPGSAPRRRTSSHSGRSSRRASPSRSGRTDRPARSSTCSSRRRTR